MLREIETLDLVIGGTLRPIVTSTIFKVIKVSNDCDCPGDRHVMHTAPAKTLIKNHSFGELGGMTISRRPNSRASNDDAPGPRQMTATAITVTNAAVDGATGGVEDPGNK